MIEIVLFVIGLVVLIKGADFLVEGSSTLAKKLGIAPMIIGLTIVAIGTSLPELLVNVFAAISHQPEIALGNIIGSNIANILLILGITVIVARTITLKHTTIWREIPFAIGAIILLLILAVISPAHIINRTGGILLLLAFVVFIYYIYRYAMQSKNTEEYLTEVEKIPIQTYSPIKITALILFGLIGLYFGGKWTVEGAIYIATVLGLSEFVISATIIAIGTSLPELVTSLIAIRKNEKDLAIGNIIGSNIVNILLILGITATITPLPVLNYMFIDLVVVMTITALLFAFMFIGKKHELERWQGIVFIILYVAYIGLIILR
ncbi:MAG: calcium/sodium antiporter [Candidatus Woesearchaeota archaeon]